MRKIITAAAIAAVAAFASAAPVAAGDDGYHDAYRPTCFMKKIRAYDSYGYLVVKRIRICA